MKRKKFVFDASLKLELANVPIVTGILYCKVRLCDGGFQAFSSREEVLNHHVTWGNDFRFNCKIFPNPTTEILEPCDVRVSVRKEAKGGKSCVKLGYVDVNLSEYAGAGECQRRYLLQSYNDNKRRPDNSILKVTVSLKVISGGPVFKAPPMRQLPSLLANDEKDEGIQEDSGRPTSMLSTGSDSTPLTRHLSMPGMDGTPQMLHGSRGSTSSVRGSTSNIRGSTSNIRGSTSNIQNTSELRRSSCTSEDKGQAVLSTDRRCDTCGSLVDLPPHQPVSDSPNGAILPVGRVWSPQSRPTHHKHPSTTIGTCSRCSSAYSTMSDSERHIFLEVHRTLSGTDSIASSRHRLTSGVWDPQKLNPELVVQKLIERCILYCVGCLVCVCVCV
jgi:hypothetical protein